MNEPLDRDTAEKYATCFRALSDATRVQIVTLLARAGQSTSSSRPSRTT